MSGARPLQVGVAELLRRPGTRRPFSRSVPLPGLAISTAAVPDGADVDVDVELESLSNGVVATGRVRAPWVGACRRCLVEVTGSAEADVREIFEPHPTEGETYLLGGDDTVDLEPLVRDAVLLALPLAPLCRDDCVGPAPDAFPTGLVAPVDEVRDPRWSAPDDLRFDN